MELLAKIRDYFRPDPDPELNELIKKYDLEGKVDYNQRYQGFKSEFTLVRVIRSETERGLTLPPEFVAEAERDLRFFWEKRGHTITFKPPRTMTQEEINEEIRRWNNYCRQFHLCD